MPKIKKGDLVEVISGKDRGHRGEVIRVIPGRDRVIVEGANIAKKHQKALRQTMQAGIIDKDMPMHISNVMVVCEACGGPSRIGYRIDPDGAKERICRKCGKELD